jgi:hypothetical protein
MPIPNQAQVVDVPARCGIVHEPDGLLSAIIGDWEFLGVRAQAAIVISPALLVIR